MARARLPLHWPLMMVGACLLLVALRAPAMAAMCIRSRSAGAGWGYQCQHWRHLPRQLRAARALRAHWSLYMLDCRRARCCRATAPFLSRPSPPEFCCLKAARLTEG